MFSTINKGLVALKAKAISELKPETEFLLETTFINGSSTKLDSAVNAWLTKITKNPKVLLIKGTAGSGKTQFCQKLTISLWEQDLDDKPIPLYIKLASLTNPKTRAIEETLEKVGFTQEQIIILKEQHTVIFILDGYNELYEFSNLHLTNGLNNWQAHTIITCRSEALYFIADYEKYFVPFKANKRLAIGLQQIDIKPLSLLQIEEFLNNHIKDNQNGITDEELTNIPGLLSLVQTPLLLKAILAVQKYSLISPIDFYKVLIEDRFLWQEQKLKLNKLIEQTIDFKRYFWSYCKNLALKMQELGTSFIYHRKSTLSLFEDYPEKSNWASFLQGDNKIQYMFAACPLVKTKENRIEFIDYCLI
ncbi:MAG: NACHT domain-containing protein, partial [Gammaproteobacteria bacterium]